MKVLKLFDLVFIIALAIGLLALAEYKENVFNAPIWLFYPIILSAYFLGRWISRTNSGTKDGN